ncbi:P0560B06.24 [Oryza sativa Japonica Group]|uniref:p0560B06.24 protein n=1 Tax=Oryza sativa subsp. japonica TaxID=39947 RepID=Q93VW1_ORYSJ|nr:P0560B06.24 [Oryza sativa Japonica Group]
MGNEIDTSVLAFLASRLQMHYSKALPLTCHCRVEPSAAKRRPPPTCAFLSTDRLGGSHDLNGRKEREFGMKKEE